MCQKKRKRTRDLKRRLRETNDLSKELDGKGPGAYKEGELFASKAKK